MRETFKYALILGLICFLSSSVLAVINSVTEPIIKAQKEEQEAQALKELLPQAAMFKPYYNQDEVLFIAAMTAIITLADLCLSLDKGVILRILRFW